MKYYTMKQTSQSPLPTRFVYESCYLVPGYRWPRRSRFFLAEAKAHARCEILRSRGYTCSVRRWLQTKEFGHWQSDVHSDTWLGPYIPGSG